eukprot:Sdes_comp20428_c0_seq3m14558
MLDFQAVLLAGGTGSRMCPLTEGIAKPLLPIANTPMIWYSLKLIENSGFSEVIVLIQNNYKAQLYHFLESYEGKLRMDIVTVAEDIGTADALRTIREKIRSDFVVISSDLVTNIPLQYLLDMHRIYDSTVTLYMCEDVKKSEEEMRLMNKKSEGEKGLLDFSGIDVTGKRLLLFHPEADLDESFRVRRSVLNRHPNFTIQTNLLDSHIYVFRRWVLDFLQERKNISSLKGELIPYLVRKQFRNPTKFRPVSEFSLMNIENIPSKNTNKTFSVEKEDPPKGSNQDGTEFLYSFALNSEQEEIFPISNEDPIRCFVHVARREKTDGKNSVGLGTFCYRANTLNRYSEANRMVIQSLASFFPTLPASISESCEIGTKSSVGKEECLVGFGTRIGDRCSIKKSIVGKHCVIGNNVSLSNCILMDHVHIEDNCKLVGSILCHSVYVPARVQMNGCQVETKCTLQGEQVYQNEIVVESSKDYIL